MINKSDKLITLTIALLLVSCASSGGGSGKPAADLILSNGKIYTLDADNEWAQAVAIRQGKILAVGKDDEVTIHANGTTKMVNLNGKMVLPGFQDVHIHPMMGGLAYAGCALFELETLQQVEEKITQCAQENPDAEFIRGNGWNWGMFAKGEKPDKRLLDAIDDTRPLLFGDSDGHTQWVNSAALRLAEISADTPDPEGGEISRDDKGEPGGALLEGPAMALLLDKLPAISQAQKEDALLYTQQYLHKLGITAIQDAYVGLTGNESDRALDAYSSLLDKGRLNLRVVTALYWEPGQGLQQIAAMLEARKTYTRDRLRVSTIKFWADGILESHTAKMLKPYSDRPETSGLLMVPLEELMEAIPVLDAEGFQVHVHAIGDATVRYALDAFEKARIKNGARDSRHLTAHTQQVHPEDIGRFAHLNAIATFSPYWAHFDEYVKTINPPQLGEQRMQQMYPIQGILDSGGRVAFGSDWSVSTADPLLGIETAVSRKDPEIATSDVLIPQQRISLHDAIAGYTSEAAYTNFLDGNTGSIEVGKYADLVILSQNLFDIPVENISDTKVTATLLEGELVYGGL